MPSIKTIIPGFHRQNKDSDFAKNLTAECRHDATVIPIRFFRRIMMKSTKGFPLAGPLSSLSAQERKVEGIDL
jgi:hypothetical protein